MTDTNTKCFVDCEELQENTSKFNFEDNTLKLGSTSLSNQQLKRISLMFATDLKNFAETFKSYCKRSLFSLAKQSIKHRRKKLKNTSSFFVLSIYK